LTLLVPFKNRSALNENDMINTLKNMFLNITNSPQYLNYIEFLIRTAAKEAVSSGSQWGEETADTNFFTNEELATLLVDYGIVPPLPEIVQSIKGVSRTAIVIQCYSIFF